MTSFSIRQDPIEFREVAELPGRMVFSSGSAQHESHTARVAWMVLWFASAGCGGNPQSGAAPNGFWHDNDGGTAIVLFAQGGQSLWLPRSLELAGINIALAVPCTDFTTDSSGRVSAVTGSATHNQLVSGADGGWQLSFDFGGLDVDGAYRHNPKNDKSNIVGTVSAQFAGSLSSTSDSLATFDYQVDYHDSSKILSSDTGHSNRVWIFEDDAVRA